MGFAFGIVHPRPKVFVPGEKREYYIYNDEIYDLKDAFVGKNVCLFHDMELTIGFVMGLSYDKYHNVIAKLFINENLPNGRWAFEQMKKGELLGLSWKYSTAQDEAKISRTGRPVPIEISLVNKGAIPGTRILIYGTAQGGVFWSKSGDLIREYGEERAQEIMQLIKNRGTDNSLYSECMSSYHEYKNAVREIFLLYGQGA